MDLHVADLTSPLLASSPLTSLWLWLGVLIVVSVIGGLAALALRRRLLDKPRQTDSAVLLGEMREMVERGEMMPEEFDRTKRVLAARAAGVEPPRIDPMPGEDARLASPGLDLTGDQLPASPEDDQDPKPGGPPGSGE